MVIVQAEGSGVLRVTVLDEGPLGTKDRTALGLPDEHGRGLGIVEALSIEHGHSSLFAGGRYWFRITPARPDAKSDAVPDARSDAPADARPDAGNVLWLDETETITRSRVRLRGYPRSCRRREDRMTVYVDPAIWPASVRNGSEVHTSNWCHMTADSLPELHRFATGLGLRRSYFQDGTFPHYDLTSGMRFKAIRFGAVEIQTRQSPDIARKLAEAIPELPSGRAGEGPAVRPVRGHRPVRVRWQAPGLVPVHRHVLAGQGRHRHRVPRVRDGVPHRGADPGSVR